MPSLTGADASGAVVEDHSIALGDAETAQAVETVRVSATDDTGTATQASSIAITSSAAETAAGAETANVFSERILMYVGFNTDESAVPTPTVKWVAVGNAGGGSAQPILTSYTGSGWTGRDSTANGTSVGGAAYSGQLWVVGGNHLWTSPDGVTWTERTSVFDGGGFCNAVAWNGSYWLAVGRNAGSATRIAKSTDGITWTNTGFSTTGEALQCVAWGPGYWVLGASYLSAGSQVRTSVDGVSWTTRTSALDGAVYDVIWANGLWVAGGYGGSTDTVQTSPDGVTWTLRSTPLDASGGFGSPFVNGITWSGSLFVAVGRDGGRTKAIMTSSNGTSWTYRSSTMDGAEGSTAAWDGSQFIAGSAGGASHVLTSPDGTTWTERTESLLSVSAIATEYPFKYGQETGGGADGTTIAELFSGDTGTGTESHPVTDGERFSDDTGTAVDLGALPPEPAVLVATASWVDTGSSSGTDDALATSDDGTTWTDNSYGHSLSTNGAIATGVAFNGSQWLVYLRRSDDGPSTWNGGLYTSDDGKIWTARTSVFDNSASANGGDVPGMCWDGSQWVVVGQDSSGTKRCASSSDGITWTTQGQPTMTTPKAVCYADTLSLYVCVGVGGSQICTSPDLSTWTTRTSSVATALNAVVWTGTGLLAAGSNFANSTANIEGSSNGTSWSSHGQAFTSGSGAAIYDMLWDGSRFVAVGRKGSTITQTMQRSSTLIGQSWYATFAGHRSTDGSLATAPAGMTNVTAGEGASADVGSHDTNGTSFGWGTATAAYGGTSSGFEACTFEVVPTGTISRIDAGTVEASSFVTMPTHASGDLLVIFAFRDGSTTAPGLPGGWTSVTTAGANSCSMRLGWKVAASGAETSGTWTNATNLVCHVYRNASAGNAAVQQGSSATVTYPTAPQATNKFTVAATSFTDLGRSICYNGTTYYAISIDGHWATSSDGDAWTDQGTLESDLGTPLRCIACDPPTSNGGRT